jgi:hypothetical protein
MKAVESTFWRSRSERGITRSPLTVHRSPLTVRRSAFSAFPLTRFHSATPELLQLLPSLASASGAVYILFPQGGVLVST